LGKPDSSPHFQPLKRSTVLRCPELLLLALSVLATAAHAHDPSAWGGMYRSRDHGSTWVSVDAGLFIGGGISLAVSPVDPNHLLYATDTRLLSSANGGRDWKQDGGALLFGPTLAVAFDGDGTGAVASTAAGVFWTSDGLRWRDSGAPAGAAPARAIAFGAAPGRVYLAGARGLFLSVDHGRSWSRTGEGLPEGAVSAVVVAPTPREIVFAVAAGDIWASADGARTWRSASAGLPHAKVEVITADPARPGVVWAVAADRLFSSEDSGATWQAVGQPLAETGTSVRGIAISSDGRSVVLTTHRGVQRSLDGGNSWSLVEGNLPVHLEAGPLIRDPHDAATLYAGFSLTPYGEVWRRADEGNNLLSQIDPVSLAGGAAFLGLIAVGGVLAVRRLARLRSVDRDRQPGESAG
jgi:photosystem II stability/assembly factor-like uncharacterized protein